MAREKRRVTGTWQLASVDDLGVVIEASVGEASDQASNLRTALRLCANNVLIPTGEDLGRAYIPPGLVRLESALALDDYRGLVIEGAGSPRVVVGPRNSGDGMEDCGTALYWAGADDGGEMINIHLSRLNTLKYLDLCLAVDDMSNTATIGIMMTDTGGSGVGDWRFERLSIVNPKGVGGAGHTTIGIQFGEGITDANCDTSVCEQITFFGLDECFRSATQQALAHKLLNCNMQFCEVFYHCIRSGGISAAGQVFVRDLHIANNDSGITGHTIFKIEGGSYNAGSYYLDGCYDDTSENTQPLTVFDFTGASIPVGSRRIGVCRNLQKHSMATAGSYNDGDPPFAKLAGFVEVVFENSVLPDQPLVEMEATDQSVQNEEFQTLATLRNCTFNSSPPIVKGLLKVTESAHVTQPCVAVFENCRRTLGGANPESRFHGTVGMPNPVGNIDSHWAPDNFDGVDGDWANSYLATTTDGTLEHYWRMNGTSTTIPDEAGTNDITVDSDTPVARGPMAILGPRCMDWENAPAGALPHSTGLSITPSSSALTVFGWFFFKDVTAEQCLWSHDPSSGSALRISVNTSGFLVLGTTSPSGTTVSSRALVKKKWYHIAVTSEGTNARAFVNGVQAKFKADGALGTNWISLTTAGNLLFGAEQGGSNPLKALVSRVGVFSTRLSNGNTCYLFMRASSQFERSADMSSVKFS